MSENMTFTMKFGSSRLVEVYEWRGDELWAGGYSIDYDEYGVERGRTEVSWNGKMTFPLVPKRRWWQFWKPKVSEAAKLRTMAASMGMG